jgi:hypothetical protein
MVRYLWDWFLQLNSGRQNNGMGTSPLAYSEILAWSMLMQKPISPFEVLVIKRLDGIYMDFAAKAQEKETKK